MTNALSVLASQPRAALAAATAVAATTGLLAHKWNAAVHSKRLDSAIYRPNAHAALPQPASSSSSSPPVRVDLRFVKTVASFLRIAIRAPPSQEASVLALVALLLAARSWLDLWASSNGGHVVKAIVARDRRSFIRRAVVDIATMMFPMSFVNNSLRYSIARLKLLMRRRLSLYLHDKYLSNNTFYKLSNLDARIRNVDQMLTVDIDRLCSSLVDLYCNISKPVFDIILFSRRLARSLGPSGPLCMILYFAACSVILRAIQPPFGQLAAEEQRLEGEYRLHHSRLITHSEEIAFFGGAAREKLYINHSFDNLVAHLNKLFAARWRNGFVDAVLVKYVATIVGYLVVSLPVFFTDSPIFRLFSSANGARHNAANADAETTSASNIAGLYTRNSRLLLQLAGAIGRLVLAGKEVTRLTGYTQRVSRLEHVLDELCRAGAVRRRFESSSDLLHDAHLAHLMRPGKLVVADEGEIESSIRFESVNIVSPDGMVLCEGLSLEMERGSHVLTTGPNGCGKSSLFRVLAGLWPVCGGTIYRPARSRIFYVPQRPYLALGSLRENVTYPMTWAESSALGATDELIMQLLERVHLGDVARRRDGLDAVKDWAEVLSGGQKQRLAFARLLFHSPQYAILDEASSAVSIDVEKALYEAVKEAGITVISVSHRPSLWEFHDRVLAFDGEGGYDFREIGDEDLRALDSSAGMAADK
eukprot:TRINITY_DN1400_c2_g1_i1.p1 TRINITY_DN1400_c2_g1~~TRINITY_DN1400_c2_g1_i1.p1  ORF type:complete len:703 (-),score=111.96 TRINITY_DN1400_c2_g1_i1:1139-3247(-)